MKKIKENICIDYLSCTFSYIEDNDVYVKELDRKGREYEVMPVLQNERIMTLLDCLKFSIEDSTKEEFALNGYKSNYTFGEFNRLQLGGPENKSGYKTCQLILSGQACREFEERDGDWKALMTFLVDIECNFTRIDIAFDIFHEDYFTIDELIKKIQNYEFTSYSDTVEFQFKSDRKGKTLKKQVYIGSLKSASTINIYDKNAERHTVAEEDTWVNTWNRIELRYKQERANTICNQLVVYGFKNFSEYASDLLYTTLDIKVRSKDSNMRRRHTWNKWERFLKKAKKIDITNQAKLESTLIKKKNWIDKSAGKSLLLMFLASLVGGTENDFVTELKTYMLDKEEKLTKKDLAILNKYLLKEHGLSPLKLDEVKEIMNTSIRNEKEIIPFTDYNSSKSSFIDRKEVA